MSSRKDTNETKFPGIPDCQEECLYDYIFTKVKFGVIILNHRRKKILFKNQYFESIARGQEKQIITEICSLIKKKEFLSGEQREMLLHINTLDFNIGLSGYTITDTESLIFLKDISSKKITQERKSFHKFYLDFSRTLGAISHEVGNPLASIGTSLQIILSNFDNWDEAKKKDYLEKTVSEIKRVSEFLKNIRNFTWEEDIDIEKVNLKQLIDRIVAGNELFISSHNINLSSSIDPEIDVMVDENAFIQVILNLIKNSISVLKEKNDGKILISTEEFNENFIKLVYKNNGESIPMENLDKIFTLFFSTKEKGRGMGLAICMKLMASMGGTIKAVEPEDGIGAEFNLYIPLREKVNHVPVSAN